MREDFKSANSAVSSEKDGLDGKGRCHELGLPSGGFCRASKGMKMAQTEAKHGQQRRRTDFRELGRLE